MSTKVFWGRPIKSVNAVGLSRKHVIEGVVGSLARLKLEYVKFRPEFLYFDRVGLDVRGHT